MQKKILAVALFGVFAGAAHAQSNLTIYGVMDMGFEYGRYDKGVTLKKLDSGDIQASRLGFRGTEDLGGGLKANFGLEMGISLDTGAGGGATIWNRGSSVGLQGDFGRVDLGKQYVPTFWVHLASDPSTYGYANPSVIDNLGHTGVVGKTGTGGFYDNVVRYRTPTMNGIDSEWSYSFGNELPGTRKSDARNVGMNVQYANGPLWAGYAYNQFTSRPATAVSNSDQTTNTIGAKYNFGVATVGTSYVRTKNMTTTTGAPLAGGNANTWHISGMIPVSGNQINVGVGRLTETGDKAAWGYHLGYVYFLSKRTQLYSYLTGIRNSSNGVRGLALVEGDYAKVTPGFNPTSFLVGVRHGF